MLWDIEQAEKDYFENSIKKNPLENVINGARIFALKSKLRGFSREEVLPSHRLEYDWSLLVIEKPKRNNLFWEGTQTDEPRNGYVSPYATKNFWEDVAETFRIYLTKEPSYYNCDPVIMKKIDLLKKYGFFD